VTLPARGFSRQGMADFVTYQPRGFSRQGMADLVTLPARATRGYRVARAPGRPPPDLHEISEEDCGLYDCDV